ncbi:MAG: hypothetical protein IPI00_02720 [Flavobacteriales bacterium]|nr:hypothetical protein [Flavobacteriales bacterium]MBK6945968.1 hypothetical protein [Flavobacteriales bacterium]MBK7239094.1 hypothetical protein [Flavobacteriales bacterium]MBK7296723.1 hypothetical protein [Flavobacteriales bacterium]MBK9536800.1 hypothetical protein [Flavobacteriales bacterium]
MLQSSTCLYVIPPINVSLPFMQILDMLSVVQITGGNGGQGVFGIVQ